ncbi:heterokaryon incompatibility protein-domain-containing protein [Thelonectria olida]|uniref:Heterokaryon incompatibility protein-domain-containing protein n=1 Tax=Thelonectria olida TaxID=1576542 RepID=A0A9P9ARN9_9HYPO|nr:heterokaryon incompatibility protein-domain-containing protein [Thelonectria olida]
MKRLPKVHLGTSSTLMASPGNLDTNKGRVLEGPLLYTRLGSEEIRIVHLHAGDQPSDIRLTTEECEIDDIEDDYAALSYVWGDSTDTSLIYVDGHAFSATKNLVAALHRIREFLHGEGVLPIWIDAICINQGDVEERNAQVAMMKQIYEKSAMIVCWLSEAGEKGLKYLDELATWVHGRPQDCLEGKVHRKPISFKTHVRERTGEMKNAAGLVTNEYWKRVWTVQEYSSPSLGQLVDGQEFALRKLGAAYELRGRRSMLPCVCHSRTQSIPVDYKSSPRELFTRVAICCMQDYEWPFGILELCRFGAAPDLPSWVPDWRTLPRKVLSRDTRTGKQILCASKGAFPSNSSSGQCSVLENDALQVKWMCVDLVTEVWEPMSQDLKDRTDLSIMPDDIDQTYSVTGEKMSEAYRELVNPSNHGGYPDHSDGNELVLLTREQWRTGKGIVGRINRRRIAKTKQGFVGLLPAEAQTTDEVWMVQGGGVFYVLRAVDKDRYWLIGEAFLHGRMQGQIASLDGVKLSASQNVVLV